ncbi:MAG TPA: hypothetical protein DIU01_10640 [Flavobacterium sp.]|nr:hypothetical protein [Flavobacterium sp.]
MTTQQFQITFFSIFGLCILTIVLSFTSFDFIEVEPAVSWTMKYFALPILIITTPNCYFIYLKYIKQHEKKEYKSKIWIQLRTIFRIFSLTLGITAIFIATTLSIIILSNAYIGSSKTINLNSKIIDYYTLTNKGQIRHYIKIQVQQLDRTIDLKVQEPYQVGQTFEKTLLIGKWGLLYSEE